MPEALQPQPLTRDAFRRVASQYATGIAIITTVINDEAHAMTANSFTTVSLDPLLVSVCVQRETRFHEAVLASGIWAASFLTSGQVPVARWFATPGRPLADQFRGIPRFAAPNGCWVLAGTLGAVCATTEQVVPAGDHDVLIARVSDLYGRPRERVAGELDAIPTVYFGSAYGHWVRDTIPPPNI